MDIDLDEASESCPTLVGCYWSWCSEGYEPGPARILLSGAKHLVCA